MSNFDLMSIIYVIPVILISLSFHEAAHAFVSYKLGDPTAKNMGRLTINPLKHLDPLGTLMMIISARTGIGFGWAKPVPINPNYYKNRKQGTMLTGLAGPVSNLLLAFLSAFPLLFININYNIDTLGQYDKITIIYNFIGMFFVSNISLAIFNLLPIPPLDGSKILTGILPSRLYFKLMQYENYVGLVFIAIVLFFSKQFSDVLGFIITPVQRAIINLVYQIISLFMR